MHSLQVLEHQPLLERLMIFVDNIKQLTVGNTSFFLFNPVSLFLAGYLVYILASKGQVKYERDWTLWYGFCLIFLLGVAVLVPRGAGGKQWGPRFLLLMVPVVILLFTWQLDRLLKTTSSSSGTARWAVLASIFFIGIAGIIQNPIRGRDYLVLIYNQVRPVVEALRADPEPLIAVSNSYLSQVFEPALDRDILFVGVKNKDELTLLSKAMLDQGQDTFTYICYSFDCKLFEPDITSIQVVQNEVGYTAQTLTVKDYGKYTIRKMRVRLSQ